MSLAKYQKQIDDWAQTLEKPYWSPLSQFARLAEETGEVGRLLNHMYGDKPKKLTEAEQDLPGELADVLSAVICLANSHNIDLDRAMEKMLEKINVRDRDRFAKKTLVVTICSKEKSHAGGLLSALERYKSRRITEVYSLAAKENKAFRILSGKFGLISVDKMIPYYDQLLTDEVASGLLHQVAAEIADSKASRVDFYIAEDADKSWDPYNRLMRKACKEAGVEFNEIRT